MLNKISFMVLAILLIVIVFIVYQPAHNRITISPEVEETINSIETPLTPAVSMAPLSETPALVQWTESPIPYPFTICEDRHISPRNIRIRQSELSKSDDVPLHR